MILFFFLFFQCAGDVHGKTSNITIKFILQAIKVAQDSQKHQLGEQGLLTKRFPPQLCNPFVGKVGLNYMSEIEKNTIASQILTK